MIREHEVLILEWAEKNGSQRRSGQYVNTLEMTYSGKFKRDYRLMKNRGYDMELLKDVVEPLKAGNSWMKSIMTTN